MEIRMARGDIEPKTFKIQYANGTLYEDIPDEIYFTVKNKASDHDYKFQKRLSDGGIVMVEPGKYSFTINPEDTNNLNFGASYDFDFEIVKGNELKKTFCGKLVLEKEVTHAYNEVNANG